MIPLIWIPAPGPQKSNVKLAKWPVKKENTQTTVAFFFKFAIALLDFLVF